MAKTKPIKSGFQFRPKKRLGQHFLKDREIILQIISLARFRQSDRILEIGSGMGAMTLPLAGCVNEIIAVEKDSRLRDMLENKLSRANIKNVTLYNADILKLDFRDIIGGSGEKAKVIGNLPYNISSPVLKKLFQHRDLVSSAVLMFQHEFATRLLAVPGGKEYGALTVLIRYDAVVSPLLEVSRDAFYPRPKVGSMVVTIDMERPYPRRVKDEAGFKRVVDGAFAHRRKTVLNSLKVALKPQEGSEISAALKTCGIDPKRRAETLDIEDFISLADALNQGLTD